MNDIKFIRQKEIGLKAPKRVVVIGAGGIGTWVAIALAQVGIEEMYIFDPDKIEFHNLNRIPYSKDEVGKYKVEALKEFLERFDTLVTAVPDIFDENYLLDEVDWIIDCTDDYKSQVKHYKYAKKNSINFLRVGTNENHITITNAVTSWNEDKEDEKEEEKCGITIPQWIGPQMIAAGYAVAKICGIVNYNIYEDIRKEEKNE